MRYYKQSIKKVLYLHSNKATTKTDTNRTYSYTWNIQEIMINEVAELQVASIATTGTTSTTVYTFRVDNLATNSLANQASDGGTPILFASTLNNSNTFFRDDFGIQLLPQSINSITITVSDDITNMNAGILKTIAFVLCICIDEHTPIIEEISQPYKEGSDLIKSRFTKNSTYM